jgi:hypothetical protein
MWPISKGLTGPAVNKQIDLSSFLFKILDFQAVAARGHVARSE